MEKYKAQLESNVKTGPDTWEIRGRMPRAGTTAFNLNTKQEGKVVDVREGAYEEIDIVIAWDGAETIAYSHWSHLLFCDE